MPLSPGQMPDNQDPKPPPAPPITYPNGETKEQWEQQFTQSAVGGGDPYAPGGPSTVGPAAPPKLPPFKIPPVPGAAKPAVVTDPYAQYKASVNQNLKYLTAKERGVAQQRQAALDKVHAQTQQTFASLKRLAAASNVQNPAVTKMLQTYLNSKGYKVGVDGNYGHQTFSALKDYIDRTQTNTNRKLSQTAQFAHPLTVRAESNAAITTLQNTRQRGAVIGYTINKIADLYGAQQQAVADVAKGVAGAQDRLNNIKQAIQGYQRLQASAKDPIHGLDPVSLDQTFHAIETRQIMQLQEDNRAAAGQNDLTAALADTIATDPLLNSVTNIMDSVFNKGSAAFAAAFETGLHTGNYFKALQAFVGSVGSVIRVPGTDVSMVGLIAPGGSDARKWIEATNTPKERDALVAKGDLLSLGQTLTGHVTPEFNKAHPEGLGNAVTLGIGLVDYEKGRLGYGDGSGADDWAQAGTKVVKGFDPVSAAADLLTLPAKDPTIALSAFTEPLANIGTWAGDQALKHASPEMIDRFGEPVIRQMGIISQLTNTVTGRAMTDGIGRVLADTGLTGTEAGLMKALPGLSGETAAAAIAAREGAPTFADGVQAAKNVITSAIVDETYNPQVSFVRQLGNNLSDRLGLIAEDGSGALGMSASLGRKAVAGSVREQWIRQFAQVKGGVASTFESDATSFMNDTLDTVAREANNNIDGLWSDAVSETVHGMSTENRYYRVVQALYHDFVENPQIAKIQQAFEGIMRPFFTNPEILDVVPHGTYMDFAFAQEGVRDASGRISQTFEDALRKTEVLTAFTDESLASTIGQKGMETFDNNLARGYILTPAQVRNAAVTAAQNIGLQLPSAARKGVKLLKVEQEIRKLGGDLEKHFEDRLNKLGGGRKGLGRLARDVQAVSDHASLREELQRVLENQAGAGLDSAPRRTGGLVQKAARAVLSTVDVIPPTEIRFKYPTFNELEHARMRAQAVTRYLQAFYVPKDVEDTLVRAAEKIQTEDEMFAFRERLTRTVLDARGVQNPDAVMHVLRGRGEFTAAVAKRPIRTVLPDGTPVEDLQMLSQRIETAKVYGPHEIAAATRQAIIDGATDANLARRMAASVRAVPDHLGEISLHFEYNGNIITLAKGVKGLHRLWKFLIVTNAGMPLVGAAAGFFKTNGSIGDRLHNAGLGLLIGSVGPARYLFRVVGAEDRFRMLMSGGFNNDIHLPAWAHLRLSHYDLDPYARSMGDDIIRVGNYGSRTNFENEALSHTDGDWVVLDRNHSRAADAWWRIGNHQVNPESDPIAAILLREKAGHLGGEETIQRVVPVETPVLAKAAAATEPPADAAGLWADAFGAPADKSSLTPLQQAADEVHNAVPVDPALEGKNNEELLSNFGQTHGAGDGHPETKTFFRGEPAANAGDKRGINWSSDESLARTRAGEDGIVYHVDLPVDEHGVPLVGRDAVAAHGEVGWLLDGPDSVWAQAADHALPNGFAASAADAAKFKVENIVVQKSDREVADAAIKQFLDSEEGALWQKRWASAIGGTSSSRKAIARMRTFIDTYMTPEMAAMRVSGGVNGTAMEIPRDVFERALKDGLGPDTFHAQQVWKIPRSIPEVFRRGEMTAQKTVLAGPSNFFNRGPWKDTLQKQEYDRMIRAGVDPERAQRIADQFANKTVNAVMHRFDEPSRLAASVDLFAPFQHAREDIVRVYSRLVVAHPGKTVRVAYYVARLFNNGKNAGVFTHNDFTGSWEVAIPGTARLSNALFGTPFNVDFHANIADFLYLNTAGFGGQFGGGFLPQPGGPFWSLFSKAVAVAHPELFTGKYPLHDWLWGYGPNGNLISKNTSRLWMAFGGERPPWEVGTQADWQSQLNRWRTEVTQQLVYQHIQQTGDTNWLPDPHDVDAATSAFFKTWSLFGSVIPSSSYPTLTGKAKYEQAVNAFTVGGLIPLDKAAFLKEYPEFEPFLVGETTQYVGPDDLATLRKLGVGQGIGQTEFNPTTGQWDTIPGQKVENYTVEDKLGYRQYISDQQFRDEFKTYQRTSQYYTELTAARAIKNPLDREAALVAVNKKYADIVADGKRKYDIELELHTIQWQYPKGLQAQAIQRVKNQYGLSNVELQYFQKKGTDPMFQPSAWRDARLGSEVAADVQNHLGSNMDNPSLVAKYVATLNPAEQARFWEYQMNVLGYDNGVDDPYAVLRKFDYLRKQYFGVRDNYPWLYAASDAWQNPFTKQMQTKQADLRTQTDATYTAISNIQAEMNAAANSKDWGAYYKLKASRDNLYTLAGEIHNKLLDKVPDLTKYYEDLHAAGVYGAAGNETQRQLMLRQATIDKADAPFFLISEEKRFLAMPAPVQRAYGKSLTEALDMPPGKYPYQLNQYIKDNTGLHKLFWEYLTPFQQHVLEQSYPKAYVDRWKSDSEYYLHGEGAIKTGRKIPDDLAYAYALLNQYSQRGDMKEPPLYQQYLQLPPNHAVRAQFLAQHPDVKAYLNASPFKHMPPHLRDVVSGILAKYGKGFSSSGNSFKRGFGRGKSGNPDLEWAKFQLFKYGALRKGQNKPATYDLWVNMPSGPAKATYLKQHPEIENWIKLGPMANMPEIYKQVVRDIMTKYGGWSQQQDPLGTTITQFFATPGYAREQFLNQHPELQAYWAATRSPEQQAMSDLENTYFSIQDVGAKKAFLASHPELQVQFLNARTNRYEQFLNQVAIYMGANPSMFEQYLSRQNDIMAELLRKFAEPMLVREQAPQVETDVTGGEGGRNRQRVRPAA